MYAVFAYVEAIADSPRAVLISGESGTGKELIARSIHTASGRNGEYVTVNVAGTDDTMFTDTMFGHVRGAFTGADRARDGLVERARGGTLFLDEIGDLDVSSQTKLLRLLQEGEYYPLGSDDPHTADVRVLAATNADLAEKQRTGAFRADLYYRLVSHHVRIPPLRERREDIPLLVERFLGEGSRIEPDATTLLDRYSFPGNVRELQAIISDAVSRSAGATIPAEAIRSYLGTTIERRHEPTGTEERFSWRGPFPTIEEMTEYLIERALSETDGNQSAAARLLGVSQSTLSRRTRRTSG
jgi:transcriptional regulator with PAS, ATPase and Fis domain